jgi:transposase-like protein
MTIRKRAMPNTDEGLDSGLLAFAQKYATDEACRDYLERKFWTSGPICPHCGSKRGYKLGGKSTRPGLHKCAECRKQYTVTIGSIFEDSHIPLPKWFAAIYLMNSSKKGISAHQLHRSLGTTYKSAWFMCHRIRESMRNSKPRRPLGGKVEVDETYIGGKTRKGIKGRGSERKTPVVALISRGGKMRTRVVQRVNASELKGAIRDMVRRDAMIYTDEWASYRGIGKEFKGHKVVRHKDGQYVKGNAHTNTAESFFALLKRGVHGTFHHISKEHLPRYCDEFSFRWDRRKGKDGPRVADALRATKGKRLTYRVLVTG